jgi:exosome complex component RRP40
MSESEGSSDEATSPHKRKAQAMAADLLAGVDLTFAAQAVIPGDDVTAVVCVQQGRSQLRLGGGLVYATKAGTGAATATGRVLAVRAGTLRYAPPATYWVESASTRRYLPCVEDAVVGVVEDRGSVGYKVAINGQMPATLPLLAFEGATKRTKPTLVVGDVVYCRVAKASADGIEPELSCCSVGSFSGSRKGWETGEATFGVLAGGCVLQRASLVASGGLRDQHAHPVLAALAAEGVAFEVVVGANGVVWVKAKGAASTVAVANAVSRLQDLMHNSYFFMYGLCCLKKTNPSEKEF